MLTQIFKKSFRLPTDNNEAYMQSWVRYVDRKKVIEKDKELIDKAIKFKSDCLEGNDFDKADYVAFNKIKRVRGGEFSRNRQELGQDGTPVTRDDVNQMDLFTLEEMLETRSDRYNRNFATYSNEVTAINSANQLALNNPVQAAHSNPVQAVANNPLVTTANSSAASLANNSVTTTSNDSVTACASNPRGQTPTEFVAEISATEWSSINDQLDD